MYLMRLEGAMGWRWGWGWDGRGSGRPISDGPNLDGRSGLVYSAGSLDGPRFGRTALDQSSCSDGRSELLVQMHCCSENSW